MTKRKPDQVIEYRVSLQDKQSEQLDGIIAAYQINKIVTPLVALLTDVKAMAFITGLLEAAGIIDLDKGILREIYDGMYENYGDAMKVVEAMILDPLLPITGAATAGGAAGAAAPSALLKGWVWMMTSGRILIEESK